MGGQAFFTVDVEDWYKGMAAGGYRIERPTQWRNGLDSLRQLIDGSPHRITLFVVGDYAPTVERQLERLVAGGHEIASHGPAHTEMPPRYPDLVDWLKRGRSNLEERFSVGVKGFRAPRFGKPLGMSLGHFRDAIAEAGFSYVSDARQLGSQSAVAEFPVLRLGRLRVGGGSYQRLIPKALLGSYVAQAHRPVLYYHSYDFGRELPSFKEIPLPMATALPVCKQLFARNRILPRFQNLLGQFGSKTLSEGLSALG